MCVRSTSRGTDTVSRFNLTNATKLAEQAYRLRVDKPDDKPTSLLQGKEPRVLEILQNAESTYDEWQQSEAVRRKVQKLMASLPEDSAQLKQHLERVLSIWEKMREYDGHYEIALAARERAFETVDDVVVVIRLIEDVLHGLLSVCPKSS